MKKMLLCVSLLLATSFLYAQTTTLTRSELASVLQKSIDLPGLQSYLPVDGNGALKSLSVYYYVPEIIPVDLVLSKGGKQLAFKEAKQNEADITDDFFIFDRIEQNGDAVKISFRFFNNTSSSRAVTNVVVNLSKDNNTWTVTSSEINPQ